MSKISKKPAQHIFEAVEFLMREYSTRTSIVRAAQSLILRILFIMDKYDQTYIKDFSSSPQDTSASFIKDTQAFKRLLGRLYTLSSGSDSIEDGKIKKAYVVFLGDPGFLALLKYSISMADRELLATTLYGNTAGSKKDYLTTKYGIGAANNPSLYKVLKVYGDILKEVTSNYIRRTSADNASGLSKAASSSLRYLKHLTIDIPAASYQYIKETDPSLSIEFPEILNMDRLPSWAKKWLKELPDTINHQLSLSLCKTNEEQNTPSFTSDLHNKVAARTQGDYDFFYVNTGKGAPQSVLDLLLDEVFPGKGKEVLEDIDGSEDLDDRASVDDQDGQDDGTSLKIVDKDFEISSLEYFSKQEEVKDTTVDSNKKLNSDNSTGTQSTDPDNHSVAAGNSNLYLKVVDLPIVRYGFSNAADTYAGTYGARLKPFLVVKQVPLGYTVEVDIAVIRRKVPGYGFHWRVIDLPE